MELLNAKVYTNNYEPEREIEYAFSCDLMSDALMLLRNVPFDFTEKGVLVTGLVTTQGVRTAEMLDLEILLLVRGKKPNEAVIEAAEQSNIILLSTEYTMFSSNGRMFNAGIKGISEL
ncbi:MAG: hypothetical protein ACI4U5_05180 [Bacilli bacterium]